MRILSNEPGLLWVLLLKLGFIVNCFNKTWDQRGKSIIKINILGVRSAQLNTVYQTNAILLYYELCNRLFKIIQFQLINVVTISFNLFNFECKLALF